MDRYKIIKTLGEGTFAIVYKASNIKTGEIVAIKKMKRKYSNWDDCIQLREIKSLRKLNHSGIIKLKEVIKVKDELYLVFEYLEQDLYHLYTKFKERNQQMTENQIKNIMWQCVTGLTYMHKNGFFHRDLKPENLLVHGNIIKICDFGLAREIRSRPPFTDYVSTRWYRAPEILLRSTNYNSPVDIFALGCIFAELYLLAPLFPGSSEVDQIYKICQILGTPSQSNWNEGYKLAAQTGFKFPQFPAKNLADLVPMASPSAISLLQDMLQYDPQKRLTAQQIMSHEYFEGMNQQPAPILPRQPTPTKKQINQKKDDELNRATDKRFKKTQNQKIQDLIESAQKLDKTQERLQNRKNSKMINNPEFNQSKKALPQLNHQNSNNQNSNFGDNKMRKSTEDFIENMLKDENASFQRNTNKKATQKQNIEDFINQISDENLNTYTRNANKKPTVKQQNVDDVINQVSKDRLFEKLAQKKKEGTANLKQKQNQQGIAGIQQDYTIESDNDSPTYGGGGGSNSKNPYQMPVISNKSVMKNPTIIGKDYQRKPSEVDKSNKDIMFPQISAKNEVPASRQYGNNNNFQSNNSSMNNTTNKPPSQLTNKYNNQLQTNKQQPIKIPSTITQKYDFLNQQKNTQQNDILDILNKNPLAGKAMFQKPQQQQPLLPQLSQKKLGYNDNPLLQPNLLSGITNKKANFMNQQNEYDQMSYGGGSRNQIGTKFMLGGGGGTSALGNIYNKDNSSGGSNHHLHEKKFQI